MVTGFQFLRLAQTLRHYGYLRFDACVADFPEKDCPVVVSAGNSELSLQLRLVTRVVQGTFPLRSCDL